MRNKVIAFFIFTFGIAISMVFQNCAGSALEAKSSDEGGLPVEVVNIEDNANDNNGSNDGETISPITEEDGPQFSFNLGSGDNVFFTRGGGLSDDFDTSRFLTKIYYTLIETHIYEQKGVSFARDLPTTYCNNSALPHCAHTSTAPCVGLGCLKSDIPVRCHWQKRLSRSDEGDFISALNEIKIINRQVSNSDPMMMDCNTPRLDFYSLQQTLGMSLANRSCVGDNEYYAIDNSGDNISTLFINEQEQVRALMDNSGGSEYCNNYSSYAWDTTKFSYRSQSGFTANDRDRYFYELQYEDQRVDIRYKETGSNETFCALGVPVQNIEIAVFFPDNGISYEILRTSTAVANIPTAEVTYEDPVDGGRDWQFFLNRGSALTNSGGAIMDSTQASAIEDLVENVLVRRARIEGASWEAEVCP